MDKAYRYIATRDDIEPVIRAEKVIKDRFRMLISQVAIRLMHWAWARVGNFSG
jgi:hypothetical protein